ncbi:MAG: hypothetical protein AAGD86_08600, partial [Pseudomonadota bacterium]
MVDFVLLGTPRKRREAIVARLRKLDIQGDAVATTLTRESDLGHHLAERVFFTAMKLQMLHALKFAERDSSIGLQVGGAEAQDRSGNARYVHQDGARFLMGTQAAHLGIGTFTRGGETIWKAGERYLTKHASAPAERSRKFGAYSVLVAAAIGLDGLTELVPAFINQSFGIV